MHLGVTHALLVIQGRVPDTVVGLSAEAIHAVALTEVCRRVTMRKLSFICGRTHTLREGTPPQWKDLSKNDKIDLQKLRSLARIERIRRFIKQRS